MRKREITAEFLGSPIRTVVQAVEPEAVRLLTERGGKISSYELHGMYYWDYYAPEDQSVLYWPVGTLSVYISPRGQDDTLVIFAVFCLPGSAQELHLMYDYRASFLSRLSFEEYFMLRVAREDEYVLRESRTMLRL